MDTETESPTEVRCSALVRPLPCPFCGTDHNVTTWECDENRPGWRCGCVDPGCDINPFTRTRWATEREAVESWNRRPNSVVSKNPV